MTDDSQHEDQPPTELTEPPDATQTDSPNGRIGPYRLLDKLGEGGMGEVWLAEQDQPVRRRVALKLIKQGMDTKQVIARFEAERQALALMSHSNVAKVYDAGATERGRPYFVMELVAGIPITEYCDKHRLDTRRRLKLFVQACAGVEHAHSKGIIHRDIKPSNVLVSLEDAQPIVKLIDFGVAKATAQRLTEKTLFTQRGLILGTPEYMSPEQAELTGLDVDSRTDVYSLGVVLYELLSGVLPFESERLRQAGYQVAERIIRDERPRMPSARVSSSAAVSVEVARRRRTDPGSLRRELRGDLDRVVMRALEKDPTQRYQSASALSLDLRRYLMGQGVVAGPRRLWDLTLPQVGALALIATIVGTLGLLLAIWPRTGGVERYGLDLLFRLRGPRPPPNGVCVVGIDEVSFQVLGLDVTEPLPRQRYADLIRALKRENARAIAFEVLFLGPSDPDQDAALSNAMTAARSVILASSSDKRWSSVLEPFKPFADVAAAVAESSMPPDPDDRIRAAPLMSGGKPALALAAYEAATRDRSLRGSGPHLIDYYGPARTVPTVSLHEALEPRVHLPPGFFQNRIVFVGWARTTAFWGDDPSVDGTFEAPWSEQASGRLHAVEVQATVAANLLEGRRIVHPPPIAEALLLFLVPILAIVLVVRLRPLAAMISCGVLAAVLLGATCVVFVVAQVWLPLVIPLVVQLPAASVATAIWRSRSAGGYKSSVATPRPLA